MLDNGLIMSPIPDDIVYVYDQNYNLLGVACKFSKTFSIFDVLCVLDTEPTSSKTNNIFDF